MEKKASKVVVGSKSAVLTAEAVYNVAHRLSSVEVDVSGMTAPKRGDSPVVKPAIQDLDLRSETNGKDFNHSEEQGFLPDVEVRATLVVILHKLLVGRYCVRKFLPLFIGKLLNGDRIFNEIPASLENGVARAVVQEIYSSKSEAEATGNTSVDLDLQTSKGQSQSVGLQVSDIGLTLDEAGVLFNLSNTGGFVGIAALVARELHSLVILADAVAAVSYEALQADTAFLDSPYFKQNHTSKTEVAVASDLSALLSGSRLVKPGKGSDAPLVRCTPSVHGALRDAAKSLGSGLTVEINREEFLTSSRESDSRFSSSADFSTSRASMMSVFVCLRSTSSLGLERTQRIHDVICEVANVGDSAQPQCVNESRDLAAEVQRSQAIVLGVQSTLLSHFTLAAVGTWNGIMAKECDAALSLLSIREKMALAGGAKGGKADVREQGEVTGKSKKTKKSFVLGKGTEIVRETLMSSLGSGVDEESLSSTGDLPAKKLLGNCLNPGVQECLDLVAKVKLVEESNEVGRLPKIAKGTRDFKPDQMVIREKAFGIITSIFKRHGAGALDTPVFELRETLMGKYGEDSKLIYDLADQGGELLSLRYDLTVPFARYLAMNSIDNMKRYHIAKVYRRDNPSKGRFREFYQCDIDIAGQYASMVPDFEILKVLTEILDELRIGEYEVKLNHRLLLDGMLDICGVPHAKFRTICSAIDKLDKLSWEEVRQEMVEEKGLPVETADKIGQLVQKRGSPSILLEELKRPEGPFMGHEGASNALTELELLFKYLKASKCLDRIVLDLSLARGLDYYTGVIYEAVFKGSQQVGSIAAGGRYDDLVGVFRNKKVPAVGVSIGIERVFAIMEQMEQHSRSSQTDVLVVVLGTDEQYTEHAIGIVTDLWKGNITAEFKCVKGSKLTHQIRYADETGIPWLVIAGEEEIKAGNVTLRNISTREQDEIRKDDLVGEMQRRILATSGNPGSSTV